MWGKIMISVYIGYDTASVDCMNIAVCCPRKAVKFNHSLTAYDNVHSRVSWWWLGAYFCWHQGICSDHDWTGWSVPQRRDNAKKCSLDQWWGSRPQGFYWALKYELKVEQWFCMYPILRKSENSFCFNTCTVGGNTHWHLKTRLQFTMNRITPMPRTRLTVEHSRQSVLLLLTP